MCTVLNVFDEIDFSDCFPIEGQWKQEVIDNPIIHLCLPAQKEIYDIAVSDNYVLTSNKSSSALFCSDIKTLKLCRTCSMSKQAVNDVTFFVSLLFLCCGKRYKIKNMDRDERYFLQVSNADNLHEELFGGGKVSCFMLIQSQCTQCKCNSTHLFLSHVS